MSTSELQATDQFSTWLLERVVAESRGDGIDRLDIEPGGRFWLGTLVPMEMQLRLDRNERGERLDPSSMGVRFQPVGQGPWDIEIEVRFRLWWELDEVWRKTGESVVTGSITVSEVGTGDHLQEDLTAELRRLAPGEDLSALVQSEVLQTGGTPSVELTFVNTSSEATDEFDCRLYEVSMGVSGVESTPYLLESLPDSFRYDRSVDAHGINCSVSCDGDGSLRTQDVSVVEQRRPRFWNSERPVPDLRFESLAEDPLPPLRDLVEAHAEWGEEHWSDRALSAAAAIGGWTAEMEAAARAARGEFETEHDRLTDGLRMLERDDELRRAFQLMNAAIRHSSRGKYDEWRPFQIGFILATASAVADPSSETFADVVWFATGGGKTETYLGLVVWAALHDRMRGKSTGVTAWSRFPLRLLSLQQTQRFADAIGGAELVRRREELGGEPFSLGFFVGDGATPNRIDEDPVEDWHPDPEDPSMPDRYRVLMRCPFCFGEEIETAFDHARWTLEHRCLSPECAWPETALPFYVVDDEIYRFLPTVIVGTLDKIASMSMQASMAGLFGPPRGVCPKDGHGHVYARRSKRPQGCLVPGCERVPVDLSMDRNLYGPTFRLQDELHLLRDSLGAVDSHYEALFDHLQHERSGTRSKVLGSSATLSGYERQVDVLYRRRGRVFPAPGPRADLGFWTSDSDEISRRHVSLAPRGATIEFANDRIITVLQQQVRRLGDEPELVCAEAGVDPGHADLLLSLFGTNVVYGNTIRDLDAAARSVDTQIPVEGSLNRATLTGQTDFEEVRETLARLEDPEEEFDARVHVVTASSMMSHGVDIDRLNTMVVLGLPLTTAEYIQTTARVGRTWPGLVFVLHKMARERDAGVFRSWQQFVAHGDRFVEPIPITRRSKRVLEQTAPGILLARLLHVHEPQWAKALTTAKSLREYNAAGNFSFEHELVAIEALLGLDSPLDAPLRESLRLWMEEYFDNLEDMGLDARFPSELCPKGIGPMRSLRDVEQQAPVRDVVIGEAR